MAPTASTYDLFLSYNSEDHDVVEDIARKLRDEGLEPFLDRWYLAPGARWRSKLEDTLSSCKAVAIFVGPSEMGSWQQREVDVALDLQSRNPNLPVIPVLLPGCEPPLGFLRQLTWVDLRSRVFDRGMAILIKAARGEAPGPDLQRHFDSVRASICPYRGLLHFREEDAPFFFGREAAIEGLVEGIKHHPFLALVGASGSGKSSVVRAGLVPRLRSDHGTIWEFISLVPTDQPLKALATALVPFLKPIKSEVDRLEEAGKLAGLFAGGTVSLYDVVRRILDKQRGTDRVLIFVDQFEELYTLVQDDAGRRKFVDELITASTLSGSKLTVAITLRGDFVGKAFTYRALSDRLQGAQINLGPMTRQELTSVIRKPAEKLQLNFEAGLVERILDAVGDEPGNLPLLEFVLTELWEKRRGGLLLNESYDTMGELKGALAKKADDFFAHLSPAERNILQRVFLRLVSPADGGEDTRRRAAFTELPLEAIDLVDKLAKERLLVTNVSSTGAAQTVEVAHEALISNWVTLRAWVNEDREFLFWRKRLEGLLREWEGVGKDEGALLRGPLLVEAQSWFDKRSQDLSEEERSFINASRALRERLDAEEKKRQEQELEDAEKRAKEQKEAASKLRRLAWVLAVVALAAVGGAIFGFWQRNEAEIRKHAAEVANAEAKRQEAIAQENANKERIARDAAQEQAKIADEQRIAAETARNAAEEQARIAKSRRLAAESASALVARYPQRSLLLATEAVKIGADVNGTRVGETEASLREVLGVIGGRPVAQGRSPITAAIITPDNHWVVTGSNVGTVCLWDLTAKDPQINPVLLTGHRKAITALAVSPNTRWLATGSEDGSVRLWNLVDNYPTVTSAVLLRDEKKITTLAMSPDSHWLVSGALDGHVRMWDLSARDPEATGTALLGHEGVITTIAISQDGRSLVTADGADKAYLWDLTARDLSQKPRILPGRVNLMAALAFSPDGHWLTSASYVSTALRWDLSAQDPAAHPVVLLDDVNLSIARAMSQDGHWLVNVSRDLASNARLWDLTAANPAGTPVLLRGHQADITAAAISPDGHWLVTGSADNTARVWNLTSKDPASNAFILRGHDTQISVVAISRDSRWLVTCSVDGFARLWDLKKGDFVADPVVLRGHTKALTTVTISADNHWLITGSEDSTIRLWDLSGKDLKANPIISIGQLGSVRAAVASPDSHWLVTVANDVVRWDLTAKNPNVSAVRFPAYLAWKTPLAISSDNRLLAVADSAFTPRVWDLNATDPTISKLMPGGHEKAITALEISPDCHWMVTGSFDQTARLWDLKTNGQASFPLVLRGHTGVVTAITISADSHWLVTGSEDGTARLWDLTTRNPAAVATVLRGHAAAITAVAISKDNRWLVTGSQDSTARLWNLTAKDPAVGAVELRGHGGSIAAVAISPDGRWLVTGGDDPAARLWSLRAKNPATSAVELRGHSGSITAVATSQDSHWLVTGGQDSTARLWLFQVNDLVDLARTVVGRNFSADEWRLYFPGEKYRKTFPDLPGPD